MNTTFDCLPPLLFLFDSQWEKKNPKKCTTPIFTVNKAIKWTFYINIKLAIIVNIFSDSRNEKDTYRVGWSDVCENSTIIFPSTIHNSIQGILLYCNLEIGLTLNILWLFLKFSFSITISSSIVN